MIVDKDFSIKAVLDLEEFLSGRFSIANISHAGLSIDLKLANDYHAALTEMRDQAVDLGSLFNFSSVESGCLEVNGDGVAEMRMIGFEEIKLFSNYVAWEYGS